MKNTIFNVKIAPQTKTQILNRVESYLKNPTSFFHIVSLNPEIMVAAYSDKKFAEILENAALQHVDGAGITLVGKILGVETGERIAGVDLMEEMINLAGKNSRRTFFLGGRRGAAEKLSEIFSKKFPQAEFQGTDGIKDIKQSLNSPNSPNSPISQIRAFSPHLLFVSFGSPTQEKWIYENRAQLGNCVAMGVGGAFDFLSGKVPRAPHLVRAIGTEWLWRLILQPWRIRRQLQLPKFLHLVFREKFKV